MQLDDLDLYLVHSVLGSGSNGVVLSVSHYAGGPKRALKILSHFWDARARALLDCERVALEALERQGAAPHGSTIAVFASFKAPLPPALHPYLLEDMRAAALRDPAHTTQFFVMESHPCSLDAYRQAWPALPFPFHLMWRLARDLLAGVRHCSAARIVHLDLKLDNVLVSAEGGAVITDFGISALLPGAAGDPLLLPYAEPLGVLINRAVLAPEVLGGLDAASAAWRAAAAPSASAAPRRAAIDCSGQGAWSVGLMLWELACGVTPLPDYPASTAYATSALPPLPEAFPFAFCTMLRGLLEPAPAQRLSATAALQLLVALDPSLCAVGGGGGSLASALVPLDPAAAEPGTLALLLRHWSGHCRLLHLPPAQAANVRCKDLAGLWASPQARGFLPPLATLAAFRAPTHADLAQARLFHGGLELLPSTHGERAVATLLPPLPTRKGQPCALTVDLAPSLLQASTLSAQAHLSRSAQLVGGSAGRALTPAHAASLRNTLLALTSLASTVLGSSGGGGEWGGRWGRWGLWGRRWGGGALPLPPRSAPGQCHHLRPCHPQPNPHQGSHWAPAQCVLREGCGDGEGDGSCGRAGGSVRGLLGHG